MKWETRMGGLSPHPVFGTNTLRPGADDRVKATDHLFHEGSWLLVQAVPARFLSAIQYDLTPQAVQPRPAQDAIKCLNTGQHRVRRANVRSRHYLLRSDGLDVSHALEIEHQLQQTGQSE